MIIHTARANETWDMLAYKYLGFEYFAKDIMLVNQHLHDVAIFEGGEQVSIPEFDKDIDENSPSEESEAWQ